MKDLRDRFALVTGSGSGIGRAVSVELARAGCHVALNDLREESIGPVEDEIRALGRRTCRVPADVADEEQARTMCGAALKDFGRIDLLVNNAGVALTGRMEDISMEDWRWILGINFWAHVHTVRALLPGMLERGMGHLVHVASMAGLASPGPLLPYGATKFAVVGFAEALAAQVRARGVGVTVVCPAFVNTPIIRNSRYAVREPGERESWIKQGEDILAHGMPPVKVARKIVRSIQKNRFLLYPHGYGRFFVWFRAVFPGAALRFNAFLTRRILGKKD